MTPTITPEALPIDIEAFDIITFLMHQFQSNEILIGIVVASILASVFYGLRNIPGKIFNFLDYHFTITLTIKNDNPVYNYIDEWCSNLNYTKKSRRVVLKSAVDEDREDDESCIPSSSSPDLHPKWMITIGPGKHYARHNKKWYIITREIGEAKGLTKAMRVSETITIKTLGRSQKKMRIIIEEAFSLIAIEEYKLKIYMWKNDWWEGLTSRLPRPLKTIILAPGLKEKLIADITRFRNSARWYAERGIIHKRGYLLSGPAGTGKTSLVGALSAHFKMPIYIMNLSTIKNDNELINAFADVPPHSVILIEDIDAMSSTQKRTSKKQENEKVTLSGILNTLDGMTSVSGSIVFMTTNHPEKLDPALIRPGRVDIHEKIEFLKSEQIKELYNLFYDDGANEFAALFNEPQSPAYLISLFMKHPYSTADLMDSITTA